MYAIYGFIPSYNGEEINLSEINFDEPNFDLITEIIKIPGLEAASKIKLTLSLLEETSRLEIAKATIKQLKKEQRFALAIDTINNTIKRKNSKAWVPYN